MTTSVRLDRDGPVATIVLNRPESLNAINIDMALCLRDVTEALAGDASVKAVVLRGEGRAFMGGGDLKAIAAAMDDPRAVIETLIANFHACVRTLHRMPKPVLASVHGAVAGGGLSLALACDLVVAAANSRFVTAYGRLGTSPDGGCTHVLSRALGQKKAAELLLCGDAIDAATAERLGLVNWVVANEDLAGQTGRIAARLAGGAAAAASAVKTLLAQAPLQTLDSQLDAERAFFLRCAETADFAEGLNAFIEQRPPRFA
ncbi:enoyl-CoA hydratase-related protein [Azospirillum sp. HJ39]|uniref:enoyl-CoA hydratase/isomerase family protein n=1 Tax=Azospirillum sp. HJ39 TaxID=3159496 RepID=UPI0035569CE3